MNYDNGLRYILGFLACRPFIGPKIANVQVSDRCNMDCVFCPTQGRHNKNCATHSGMDLETFKEATYSLKKLGTKTVLIAGTGEPFLNQHIWQMIDYTCSKGMDCYILTNGTLLGKSEIIRLGKLGVSGLLISIQAGNESSYAEVQGGKNKRMFNKIKKSLEIIKEYKKQGKNMPIVRLSEVVYNKNYSKLNEIIEFASKMDVSGVVFRSLIGWNAEGYFERLKNLKLSDSQKAELFRNIPKYIALAKNLRVKTNLPLFEAQVRKIIPSRCYAGFMNTRIMLNGDVSPCCNNPPVMGNIKKAPFKEVWISDTYKKFRKETCHMNKKISNLVGCEDCTFALTNEFYYQKWPNPWAFLKYASQSHQELLILKDII